MSTRIRRGGLKLREPAVRVAPRQRTGARLQQGVESVRQVRVDPTLLAELRARVAAETSFRIAVLVPVLSRPGRVRPLVDSFHAATKPEDAEIYFVAQTSDIDELAAIREADLEPILVTDAERSWAKKINKGYSATTETWILLGADDLAFRPGWVDAVRDLLVSHPGVIGTNDLGNPQTILGLHSTHPLVRRAYADVLGTVDERGKVVHDGYDHNYPDTELVHTATARGLWIHRPSCIIEHLHPVWGKAQHDHVYALGQRNMQRDQALFMNRGRRFGW